MTPARHTHAVIVEVKSVHCPEITPRRGLALSTTATQMGTKVQFSCNNGNALIGTPEITCLASGNWSGPLPICESRFGIFLDFKEFSIILKTFQVSNVVKFQFRHL